MCPRAGQPDPGQRPSPHGRGGAAAALLAAALGGAVAGRALQARTAGAQSSTLAEPEPEPEPPTTDGAPLTRRPPAKIEYALAASAVGAVSVALVASLRIGYLDAFGAHWEDTGLNGYSILVPALAGLAFLVWSAGAMFILVQAVVARRAHAQLMTLLIVLAVLVAVAASSARGVGPLRGDVQWLLQQTGVLLIYAAAFAWLSYAVRTSATGLDGSEGRWSLLFVGVTLALAGSLASLAIPLWVAAPCLVGAGLVGWRASTLAGRVGAPGTTAGLMRHAPWRRVISAMALLLAAMLAALASLSPSTKGGWVEHPRALAVLPVLAGLALLTSKRVRVWIGEARHIVRPVAIYLLAACVGILLIAAHHTGSTMARAVQQSFGSAEVSATDGFRPLLGLQASYVCATGPTSTLQLLIGSGSGRYLLWDPENELIRVPVDGMSLRAADASTDCNPETANG